jgi:glutathione peroxidase
MKLTLLFAMLVFAAAVQTARAKEPKSPLDFEVKRIDGKDVDLSTYKGKVVLIVNVASQCGYTDQYENLENLNRKYKDRGLAVLGFPANEFGGQEPGTDEEIATFCKTKYAVDFDMFSKIVVNGDGIAPLYEYLTSETTNPKFGGDISWNFEKFLIGRDGQVIARFASDVNPEDPEVVKQIEKALDAKTEGAAK